MDEFDIVDNLILNGGLEFAGKEARVGPHSFLKGKPFSKTRLGVLYAGEGLGVLHIN